MEVTGNERENKSNCFSVCIYLQFNWLVNNTVEFVLRADLMQTRRRRWPVHIVCIAGFFACFTNLNTQLYWIWTSHLFWFINKPAPGFYCETNWYGRCKKGDLTRLPQQLDEIGRVPRRVLCVSWIFIRNNYLFFLSSGTASAYISFSKYYTYVPKEFSDSRDKVKFITWVCVE